jgi:hypothetical protein
MAYFEPIEATTLMDCACDGKAAHLTAFMNGDFCTSAWLMQYYSYAERDEFQSSFVDAKTCVPRNILIKV